MLTTIGLALRECARVATLDHSIVFGYELSTLQWRLIVVFIFSRAFRQLHLIFGNFLVGDLSKDV